MSKAMEDDQNIPKEFPLYDPNEDIYIQSKKVEDIDPEDITAAKETNREDKKDLTEDSIGEDLDIPGSELDDQQESIGSEDEENNYYSLGGDNHNNLEEENSD